MLNTNGAPQRARWAVMWVYTRNGHRRVFRKDFKDDLASAEDLYLRARDAKRPAVTLACVNMGFPPPVELRPHTVTKRGRSKTTGKIKTVSVEVQPLKDLNMQGKLWCPHCRKLRPFVFRKTFTMHGTRVFDPRYECPICGISHRDHHVRVWNPTAVVHMESSVSSRRYSRSSTQTRRRRRR